MPNIGDKFASRAGQKGTVGILIREQDMPFTGSGLRPDIIINPHAIPSRMTIGQLVETLTGKACALYGTFGDCTAFMNTGPKEKQFGSLLTRQGFHSSGSEKSGVFVPIKAGIEASPGALMPSRKITFFNVKNIIRKSIKKL